MYILARGSNLNSALLSFIARANFFEGKAFKNAHGYNNCPVDKRGFIIICVDAGRQNGDHYGIYHK